MICPGRHVTARATTPRTCRTTGAGASAGISRLMGAPEPETTEDMQEGNPKPCCAVAGLTKVKHMAGMRRAVTRKPIDKTPNAAEITRPDQEYGRDVSQ
jgi:hypothetical protein